MAVMSYRVVSANEVAFELITAGDDHVTLIAVRKTPPSHATPSRGPEGPVAIELTASVGLFGDQRAERKLLEAVRDRLSGLAGVDFAPIR